VKRLVAFYLVLLLILLPTLSCESSGVIKVVGSGPTWSPDGTLIAFVSNSGGSMQIYVMKANGQDIQRITMDSSNNWGPTWAPSGNRIAFYSDREGDRDIYIV
jgi:Tol biopolymer transport system component